MTCLGRVLLSQVNGGEVGGAAGEGPDATPRLVWRSWSSASGHCDGDPTPRERRRRPGSSHFASTCSDPRPAPMTGPTGGRPAPASSARAWVGTAQRQGHGKRAAQSVEKVELKEKEEDTAWWRRRRGACRWRRRGADEGEEVEGRRKTVGPTPDMWSHYHVIQNLHQYH
jgi:hypothetical protein